MTIKEQHIEVRLQLNQLGADRGGKYDQDQIDWVLNKMEDRFIRSCLRPKDNGGFEIDELKADDISGLIVSGSNLSAYLDGTRRYKSFLPPDYLYLLDDNSLTNRLCSNEVAVVADRPVYLDTIRQERTAKSSARYYVTNVVSLKGTTVNVPNDLPYGNTFVGYNSKDDFLFLVPFIAAKGGWYWEKAAGETYPGQFIRLSETAGSGSNSAVVDGTSYTVGTTKTLALQVHTNTGILQNNRLTASNLVQSLNNGSPFYRSSYYSPISELSGNVLYIYRDTSFTVSGVVISYIRKPQRVSLSLNTNSELSHNACQIVCDLVSEYINGVLRDIPGVQAKTNDINTRVTL